MQLAIHVVQNRHAGEQKAHWDKQTKGIYTFKINGNFLCLNCPSTTFALKCFGLVPREWLDAKGLLLCFGSEAYNNSMAECDLSSTVLLIKFRTVLALVKKGKLENLKKKITFSAQVYVNKPATNKLKPPIYSSPGLRFPR